MNARPVRTSTRDRDNIYGRLERALRSLGALPEPHRSRVIRNLQSTIALVEMALAEGRVARRRRNARRRK